jgi:hypothetical protein
MTTARGFAAFHLVLLVLLAMPQPVFADVPIVVGNGTAASCTEVTLESALDIARASDGGRIRFSCGRHPITIAVTATLSVPNNTTIDGGGLISLDGGSRVTIVSVDRNATVLLKNLGFSHGPASVFGTGTGGVFDFDGGAVFNEGRLTIDNNIFSASKSPRNEGAVGILNRGALAVKNSTFSDNDDGIANAGTLVVTNTVFSENGGIAIFNGGPLGVDRSRFSGNGGGIFSFGNATVPFPVTVESSRFSGNHGAGIDNLAGSLLTIKSSKFSDNESDGVVFSCCSFAVVDNSQFSGNGGNGMSNHGQATVRNSSFFGNSGLGISSFIEAITIEKSAIFRNSSGGIFNAGSLTIRNSTITQNTGGGGIFSCCGGIILELDHTVVSGNEPFNILP